MAVGLRLPVCILGLDLLAVSNSKALLSINLYAFGSDFI